MANFKIVVTTTKLAQDPSAEGSIANLVAVHHTQLTHMAIIKRPNHLLGFSCGEVQRAFSEGVDLVPDDYSDG